MEWREDKNTKYSQYDKKREKNAFTIVSMLFKFSMNARYDKKSIDDDDNGFEEKKKSRL